eukprot:12766102-Alexandrium_andersonii.AAC.1
MSASLVGSEMCIRDSDCSWACVCGLVTFVCGMIRCASHVAAAGVLIAAVSYTHLTLPTICSV